jgi:hypothetical protein
MIWSCDEALARIIGIGAQILRPCQSTYQSQLLKVFFSDNPLIFPTKSGD